MLNFCDDQENINGLFDEFIMIASEARHKAIKETEGSNKYISGLTNPLNITNSICIIKSRQYISLLN